MPDVRAQLIITARDEASATLKQVGQTNQQTVEGLKITNAMILAGVTAVGLAMKDAIDTTENWGETIGKLSRASGENATETSKMAVVLGDLGVNADSLGKVIKAFTKEGLQFNLDTLKDLATQYQAIQDPVLRDKFAFENFGRSAMDMTIILSKTPAELDAIGASAMTSGKILNDQMVSGLQASGIKFQQFQDKIDGLKIALGIPLIGVLGGAIDGFYNLAKVVQSLDIAVMAHTGVISWDEATAREAAVAQGDLTGAYKAALPAITNLAPAITANNVVLPAFLGYLKDTSREYSGAAALVAFYTGNLDDQAATQAKAKQNTDDYNKVLATQEGIMQGLAAAAMDGSIDQAQKSYQDTVKSSSDDIGKLTKQIAEMEAANGKEFTTVVKGKVSQEDYNLAVERAALSQAKYDAALQGTVDAHGKVHKASDLTLEGMRIAAESAANAVDKLSGKMGSSSSDVADYSQALIDAKGKLADLQQKEAEAAKQIADTTGKFILQQLALDMGTGLSGTMKLQLEHALGLINDKEYTLAQTVMGATKLWDLNKNGVIDAGVEYNSLTKYLADQQAQVVKSAEALPALTGSIAGTGGAAHHAMDDINQYGAAINGLPTSHVTTITTLYGTGGPGYEGSVVTPPGSGTGMGSGAGGGGGGTGGGTSSGGGQYGSGGPGYGGSTNSALTSAIHNLPAAVSRAVRDAMQMTVGR